MSEYDVIAAKARNLLKRFGYEYLIHPQSIPIEEIIEKLGITIEYQYLTKNGEAILGKFIHTDGLTSYYDMELHEYQLLEVTANTILVEVRLKDKKNSGRLSFTLAHELAHWLLHKNIFKVTQNEAAFVEESDEHIERQADMFASELLMPTGAIKKYFYSLKCKRVPDDLIVKEMAGYFKVSEQAMRIKLESRSLIEQKEREAYSGLFF